MSGKMIVAEDLERRYGDFIAVSDVSFEIGTQEVVGLLGHNGAGKTTIMKMLTGYLEPTAGRVLVDGIEVEAERTAAQSRLGYLPENCPVYPEMTVVAYLDFVAELRGLEGEERRKAVRRAMEATELEEKAAARIATLSRGYRQRVGVAQAILHQPKVVILDEPTNGLDPSQIRQMRRLIKRLAETSTVILSTHILQEVQAVCDRVIIINRGKLALDSKLSDLSQGNRLRLVTDGALDDLRPALVASTGITAVDPAGEVGKASAYTLALNGHDPKEVAAKAAQAVHEKGYRLFELHCEQRDIETVFAQIAAGESGNREVAHV